MRRGSQAILSGMRLRLQAHHALTTLLPPRGESFYLPPNARAILLSPEGTTEDKIDEICNISISSTESPHGVGDLIPIYEVCFLLGFSALRCIWMGNLRLTREF